MLGWGISGRYWGICNLFLYGSQANGKVQYWSWMQANQRYIINQHKRFSNMGTETATHLEHSNVKSSESYLVSGLDSVYSFKYPLNNKI